MTTSQHTMTQQNAQQSLSRLNSAWQISDDGKALVRRYSFKSFAKTMLFVNLLAAVADKHNHHPDAAFGWGYCHVTFTTHDADGLTELDFSCAELLDSMANH